MVLTPHYQPAGDARAEQRRQHPPRLDGLTTVSFFVSTGALAKAGMVSGGIIWDEKLPVIFIPMLASALGLGSLYLNLRRRRRVCAGFSAVSLTMLAAAFVLTVRGWR